VLLSIGVPIEVAHGSIRFSFGKNNTLEEAKYTVEKLVQTVDVLRKMSPLYNK
jgi:cysteine desulfurase